MTRLIGYIKANMHDAIGTSLKGHITATYVELVAVLGEPEEADGYKASGEWSFVHEETGDVVTLYDWKETNLYSSDYPSVEAFRTRTEPTTFHIGANDYTAASDFKIRLERALGRRRNWGISG